MKCYKSKIVRDIETEIVVVGGGSSGIIAAYAASKEGKKVLLVERNSFLGGISTSVLDTFNGFYSPTDCENVVVTGYPYEVVNRLKEKSKVVERANTFGSGKVITYNSEILKCVYDDMLTEADVQILLHANFHDVIKEDNQVRGIIISCREGLIKINAKVVIDASGDANVCHLAGVPFEKAGELEPAQTLTTTFRLGNVDTKKADTVPRKELVSLMKAANESGEYSLPREEGSIHITPIDGVMHAIMTKLDGYDPCDINSITEAEIEGRKQVLEYSRFLKDKVSGYENSSLIYLSTEIGVRETRRVYGEYRLTKEDVLNGEKFDDSIGICTAPIEDHSKGKGTKWEFIGEQHYGIPFRTLIPKEVEGLLVVGRCFSATHDAHASCRSLAQTMAMGQAAGIASSLAIADNVSPGKVDVSKLRNRLKELGNIIE